MKFEQINISKPATTILGLIISSWCISAHAGMFKPQYSAQEINSVIAQMYGSELTLERQLSDSDAEFMRKTKNGTDASAYDVPHDEVIALMKKDNLFAVDNSKNDAAPVFSDFKTERMIQNRANSDSLCDILADPKFKMPMLDWSKIEDAWDAFTAAAAVKTKGINFSAVMNLITKKAMNKLWEKVKSGTCKMAQKASRSVDHSINKAYNSVKQKGIDTVIDSDVAQKAGLTSLDKDGLTNIASKQTSDTLKQYDSYGHWYEKGYFSDKNLSSNIDDIISSQIDKSKEKLIDKVAPADQDSMLDKLNNKVEDKLF